MAKLNVMNSTIGFRPVIAAPTPTPAKPCSVIGVSMTRLAPNSCRQTLGNLVGTLVLGDFLAHDEDIFIGAHFLGHGIAQRFAHGLADEPFPCLPGMSGSAATSIFGAAGAFAVSLEAEAQFFASFASLAAGGVRTRACGFGLRLFLLRCGGRRQVVCAFAFLKENGNCGVFTFTPLGTGIDQDLADDAFIDGFDFHRRLVGFDFRNHVAGGDLVALFLQPLGKRAFLHGRGKRGHQNFYWHCFPFPDQSRMSV